MTASGTHMTDEGAVRVPRRRRGILITVIAVLLALVIIGHRLVPNVRGMGSLLDTVTPFLGLGIPLLALAAALRRAWPALAAAIVPTVAWVALFGPAWLPGGGGPAQVRVVSQNLLADNAEPQATVDAVVDAGADLVALQEVSDGDRDTVAEHLGHRYPYQVTESTVGLWSRFPIRDAAGVDTGLGWTRALRAVVGTPNGDLTVYVVHLGSARAGETAVRDRTVRALAGQLRRDTAQRVIALGDFNTASTDRMITPLTDLLRDAQADAGTGPGFTWPSRLPLIRPDHVFYRGLTATSAGVLRTPASDHRAVTAGFRW
ncbi:endonuclease/exonuclease/phosphatase family protein [Micromonospora zhanjiangensis]|uniref:Endonuclease/exonuclease/phosphatase family protein n=1 Tax=Micromonospora zhanjiangensis TaxID=1522057 RepID=A0ABV8KT23_9ACTN